MKKWLYGFIYILVVLAFSMVFSYTYIQLNEKSSIFIEHINIDDVPSSLYTDGEEEDSVDVEPIPTSVPVNTPVPTVTPTNTPVPTVTPTPIITPIITPNVNPNVTNYNEDNIKLVNKIRNEFGVNIKYGDDIKNYVVSDMTVIPITNDEQINNYLNNIYNTLKLYPSGMLKEVSDYGFRLSFYLITRFSTENVAGVTEQKNLNVIITIATEFNFSETVNHELFHYFDAYMDLLGNNNSTWGKLNPTDFTYGKTNTSYSFFSTYRNNAYFVNDYAQTDDYEDRAVTFEYMMADYELKCFENGTPINKKARLISETLDKYFESVTSSNTERWERYIK